VKEPSSVTRHEIGLKKDSLVNSRLDQAILRLELVTERFFAGAVETAFARRSAAVSAVKDVRLIPFMMLPSGVTW
jgi:hypothetical protein